MNVESITAFSIALQLPPNRSVLVKHMLDGAATELRERGILWRMVDAAADVTFRLGRSGADENPGHLYADVRHPERGVARVRIDGPLRTAAVTAALARIARALRSTATDPGAAAALRWLDQWDALVATSQPAWFCIGESMVALLVPGASTWHPIDSDGAPDIEHLVERMAREGFTLRPAEDDPLLPEANLSLKPLLWQLALVAGQAGRMRGIDPRSLLRLKGWPYLAAGGPKSFGELIRLLRGNGVSAAALDASGVAAQDDINAFLNACHACGFLIVEEADPVVTPLLRTPLRPLAGAQPSAPILRNAQAGKVGRVISSIRRSLGMGAG